MGMQLYEKPDCQAAGDDRTVQSHKKECDINNIVEKAAKTGVVTHLAKYGPTYGDATGPDYETALNLITNANSMFAELPAEVRREFHGDPRRFLDFVADPANQDDLAEKLPALAKPGTQLPDVAGGKPAERAQPASTAPTEPPKADPASSSPEGS